MNYIEEELLNDEYVNATFKNGFIAGIPIGLGYFVVSFTFGMTACLSGLSPLEATLMSMSNCTSAGQFAGTNLITGASTYLELLITVSIINIRYLLMSTALSQKLHPSVSFLKRIIISFGITDETYAVSSVEVKEVTFPYFMGLFSMPYIGWALGTLLGSVMDNVLDERMQGAAAIALYCMFIALVIPPAKHHKDIRFVVIITIILRIIFTTLPLINQLPMGYSIIICAMIAALIGALKYREQVA